ncbi:hypothetical protein HDU98_005122 [Podochytrium sp. JEL0797]|nr:hypothetical protein HDU98_005119 [Podochytrium sp. JEL0797]KAJ3071583.1 hypothetical protein HDU98_005122 [Podochytrium sp. JEL0797]
MKLLSIVSLAVATIYSVAALATPPVGEEFVGGYVLFGNPKKLQLLAETAATLPVNRVFLSFVRPDMYYVPGSNTLVGAGLNYNNTQTDFGFAEVKKYVQQLQAGGVEVFIAMGGWDYTCWPWAYMQHSISNYGTTSPTFQSTIQKYGGGNVANCNEANQYCYTCEPITNGNTPESFTIFPEPENSPTWKQAQAYVTSNNKMGVTPVWHPELIGGASYSTPLNGVVKVPGDATWAKMGRDPYQDLVYMAKDLGLDGVDIDYEEFWHADMFKVDASAQKNCGNGCTLFQTVFKFTAILEDLRINVQKIYPSLKVATAASAAGAWAGTWWGGNLKGLTLNMVPSYPDLVSWVGTGANAGGWNIMTYDLSNSTVNCPPAPATCSLDGQVDFYMAQHIAAGVSANVGYELGTPAYPPPADKIHQMPLSNDLAGAILSNVQPYYKGGFFWEMFKPQGSNGDVPVSVLAQAICKKILGANTPRCSGSIPTLGGPPALPGSSDVVKVSDKPAGPKPLGPQPCAAPFVATQQYTAGNKASFQGYNYIVNYYPILGTLPNTPSSGWAQQGLCIPTTVPTASTGVQPTAGTAVPPATTAAPPTQATPCHPSYVKGQSYSASALVSYNSVNYQAKWWQSGATTPDLPGDGGWASQGACSGSVAPKPSTTALAVSTSAVVPPPQTTAAVQNTTAVVPPPQTTAAVQTTTASAPQTTAAAGTSPLGQVCTAYSSSQCVNGTMFVCLGAGPYTWSVWYKGC